MLGVIGGLGPLATSRFYRKLMDLVSSRANGSLPRIVMYNVAMSPRIENAFLAGTVARDSTERIEVRKLLTEAVAFFARNGVEIIAMPCNTLQEELAAICSEHGIAHLDMIDETVKSIVSRQLRRVLVLGTSNTCQVNVYGRRLGEHGITCIYPEIATQREVERTIREALDRRGTSRDEFITLLRSAALGCDGIVIACTDLVECASEGECGKPVIDSLHCLARGGADWILQRAHRFLIDVPRNGGVRMIAEGIP